MRLISWGRLRQAEFKSGPETPVAWSFNQTLQGRGWRLAFMSQVTQPYNTEIAQVGLIQPGEPFRNSVFSLAPEKDGREIRST